MKALRSKLRISIFLREVGKHVVAFWVLFAIGAAIALHLEWSVSATVASAIFFLGTILSAVFGWREFQIESHLEGMREYGRFAASIGRPSDFYKKEHINVDVADEIAIMQGWDLGWKEFRDLPKEQQALSAEQNRRAPPQPLFDRSAPASHTDSQNQRGKQSARRTE